MFIHDHDFLKENGFVLVDEGSPCMFHAMYIAREMNATAFRVGEHDWAIYKRVE